MSWTAIPARVKAEAAELLARDAWLTPREIDFLTGLLNPLRLNWSDRQRGWFEAIGAKVEAIARRQRAQAVGGSR